MLYLDNYFDNIDFYRHINLFDFTKLGIFKEFSFEAKDS